MSGRYSGAQSHILNNYKMSSFLSPRMSFIQLSLTIFSFSLSRCSEWFRLWWVIFLEAQNVGNILYNHIGLSLHGLLDSHWTKGISCIRPFTAPLPGIKAALNDLLSLNLTEKARTSVNGTISCLSSFKCVIMAAIWMKILSAIDIMNQII